MPGIEFLEIIKKINMYVPRNTIFVKTFVNAIWPYLEALPDKFATKSIVINHRRLRTGFLSEKISKIELFPDNFLEKTAK